MALVCTVEGTQRLEEEPNAGILDDVEHRNALAHRRPYALVLILCRSHSYEARSLVTAQSAAHMPLASTAVTERTSLTPATCGRQPRTLEELRETHHLLLVVRREVAGRPEQRLGRLVLVRALITVIVVEELDWTLVQPCQVAQLDRKSTRLNSSH